MAARPTITLDRNSPIPLYFQVAEQFEAAIVAGELQPGDRLETEIALARDLGLSRPTMRQAMQMLVDKGMLVRRRGIGTQVVHGQVRRPLELTSLYDDLAKAGEKPETAILSLEGVSADDAVAAELGVPLGSGVWALQRVRSLGGEPLALMTNYLPVDLVDLESFDLRTDGLYASLRRAGVSMSFARQRIGCRRAHAREARLLTERRGAPLLTMERTAYDLTGRAVEYGRHAYRADRYAFELTLMDR